MRNPRELEAAITDEPFPARIDRAS
jgi:hypothetical protein